MLLTVLQYVISIIVLILLASTMIFFIWLNLWGKNKYDK